VAAVYGVLLLVLSAGAFLARTGEEAM